MPRSGRLTVFWERAAPSEDSQCGLCFTSELLPGSQLLDSRKRGIVVTYGVGGGVTYGLEAPERLDLIG